jgi:6-phosphogluconolactonase
MNEAVTKKFELLSFPDPASLAAAAAEQWVNEIEGTRTRGQSHCVALSGGRIARVFYSATATAVRKRAVPMDHVEFFWGDERCVPPTDPESNFAIARDLLFAPLGIAEARIHRVKGEASPEVGALEAAKELSRVAPLNPEGQPVLDLIFLGLGEDGHVASLFPAESEQTRANAAICRAVVATKPPPQRITIGYGVIAAARQVWVLASGAGKEAALQQSLQSQGQAPLARVLKLRQSTRIFSDIPIAPAARVS